jgi:hypothetical protein
MRATRPYNNEVFVVEDFVTKQELERIVKYLRIFFKHSPNTLSEKDYLDLKSEVNLKIKELYVRAINVFNEHHDIEEELEFSTLSNFVCIDGVGLPAHHDNNRPGAEQKVRYGCVVYFTDDFEGGELNYTELGISHKPVAGQLILHPGTEEYIHSVTDVSNGIRLTSTMFILEK